MNTELLNSILAFFEGFVLIISPCILPILPIIFSTSIQGSKKRPYGVILGFIATFILLTFFSRSLLTIIKIDWNIIRNISFALLILSGIIMISDRLTEKFDLLSQRLAGVGSSWKIFNQPQAGFASGVLFGSLIGIIWTPCAGPILAAIILQIILQKTNLASFITILSFGIGVAIPMLLIAIFGRKIIENFSFLKKHAVLIRKILGGIIILSVLYMIFGYRITFSTEETNKSYLQSQKLIHPIAKPYSMPKIEGITAWINSNPISMAQLKSKVILIDFWTYSCINCIRTLPYLKSWYQKYHDKNFIIIGIHSPEFDFEKDLRNVKDAVKNLGIKYPVALDNDFVTWQNFSNMFWPAHYLIDQNGRVVYRHFGEGDYDALENNIRFLLGMNAMSMREVKTSSLPQTPETYLGYERSDRLESPESIQRDLSKKYSYPERLSKDAWALSGNWIINNQHITSDSKPAAIKLHFRAKKVYAVMGSNSNRPIAVQLLLNNNLSQRALKVKEHDLYTLIDEKTFADGILELIALTPGLEIYTFTFGG